MIKDVVGHRQQPIAAIHGVSMTENRLPNLAIDYSILSCFQ
jgi:hypothetical protein